MCYFLQYWMPCCPLQAGRMQVLAFQATSIRPTLSFAEEDLVTRSESADLEKAVLMSTLDQG